MNTPVEFDLAAADPDEPDFDGVEVESHDGVFIASKPSVGALSAFSPAELLSFHSFYPRRHDHDAASHALDELYERMDVPEDIRKLATPAFLARMDREGWLRDTFPQVESERLRSLYFTVTRRCDLACRYCYQGLSNRTHTEMTLAQAELALDKVAAYNPNCLLMITGGEPFSHPHIFEILELADARGLRFTILSNGTYIDDAAAARLRKLENFWYIQLSIDGISEEVHSMTRGKGHLEKVMRAFRSIVAHGLPFVLAPTCHDANLGELVEIASLAIEHGGWCKPNNMREFPHEGLSYEKIHLSNDRLLDALQQMNKALIARFGLQRMAEVGRPYQGASVCSVDTPNAKFICGMGHSLLDLDWNGDIYPCHLTKDQRLILGNLYTESFAEIFARAEAQHVRVMSHEIPKCSGCKFVSNCAGGCRAGAWFTYGSLAREDNLCSLNYESSLRKLVRSAKR
jgi:radical SAM protein with 4Fe4S-binding SPASM domain